MEQTSLNIGTIGQKLESARQEKGVSVSEAGQATKILSKFIEAMEADDFGALSAPIYAKSFLKMYAKYLGIDFQPLVSEYTEQYAPKSIRSLSDEARQNLTPTDQAAGEVSSAVRESSPIFSGGDSSATKLAGFRFPPKTLVWIGGSILTLLIILFSVTQCAGGEDEPASAEGVAFVERQQLFEDQPNAYLVKYGEIEVN